MLDKLTNDHIPCQLFVHLIQPKRKEKKTMAKQKEIIQ